MTPFNLQRYPAYKPSGVEWLGDVPENWEVVSLKRLGSFKSGAGFPINEQGHQDLEVPFFKVSDMNLTGNDTTMQTWNNSVSQSTAARLKAAIFPAGTIIFPKVGGAMLTNKRRTLECSSCIDNNLMGCVVARGNPEFVLLLLQRIDLSVIAKPGPVPAISEAEVREIRVALPRLPEQAAIVRYLDYVDRRVRRYVAAKERLIGLLEEEKQAVINQAITRGLDPNVPLKPSGVEWLGDIPAHWEVIRNGQLFVQRNETGFPELPILEVSLRTGVRLRDFRDSHRKQIMSVRSEYKRAVKGDVAYNMMRMWQGAVGVVPTDGLVSPAYVVAKPRRGTEPRYFSTLFRTTAYMFEVDKYSRGIVKDRNRLYWEDFKQMPTPCPPPEEQVLISDAIDRSMAAMNDGVNRIHRQIELIQEYRTGLIADVVTGKLDVREAAAGLPDKAGKIRGGRSSWSAGSR